MHADTLSKHKVEIEQVDKITRLISSSKQGECCRDFLRYFANLKTQFGTLLTGLD